MTIQEQLTPETKDIISKLDMLDEYHSQKEAIELNKRTLLDDVKVPADVEEIVKNGMKRISEIGAIIEKEQQPFYDELQARYDAIAIPDEIKKALAEIDAQRAAIIAERRIREDNTAKRIQAERERLQAEVQAQTKQVYLDIAARKAEIEAEFSGATQAVDENIKKLEDEIRADTKNAKKTVKGKYFMAVYNRGRITWNTDMMEAWMQDHPFLAKARKEGDPSITIRKV